MDFAWMKKLEDFLFYVPADAGSMDIIANRQFVCQLYFFESEAQNIVF